MATSGIAIRNISKNLLLNISSSIKNIMVDAYKVSNVNIVTHTQKSLRRDFNLSCGDNVIVLGAAKIESRVISISIDCPINELIDTVLHEFAHVISGQGFHNKRFKDMFKEIKNHFVLNYREECL